jgi:hypothetical protein
MIIIVLLNMLQSFGFIVLGVLYFTVIPNYEQSDSSLVIEIYKVFNPFLKPTDCDVRKDPNCNIILLIEYNEYIMANMMILSIPEIIASFYVTYKGFVAWGKRFEIKATERFYRYNFTYYVYKGLITLLIFIQIGPANKKISIWVQIFYIVEIIITIFFLLPIMNRFLAYKKEE